MQVEFVLYNLGKRTLKAAHQRRSMDTAIKAAEKWAGSRPTPVGDGDELYVKDVNGGFPMAMAKYANGQWAWA